MIITALEICNGVVCRIRDILDMYGGEKVLGMDVEWNRGRNPVATIQLSCPTGETFIFCLKGILGARYCTIVSKCHLSFLLFYLKT